MEGPPKELANLRMIAADLCGKAILRRFGILEVKWLSGRGAPFGCGERIQSIFHTVNPHPVESDAG
jgi:hypothetical protein